MEQETNQGKLVLLIIRQLKRDMLYLCIFVIIDSAFLT